MISNGTAVLGLGNIGALASKPVMEGRGIVQKFAGINVFDIEINEHDPDKLIDIIASLEPTLVLTLKISRHRNVSHRKSVANVWAFRYSMMTNTVQPLSSVRQH